MHDQIFEGMMLKGLTASFSRFLRSLNAQCCPPNVVVRVGQARPPFCALDDLYLLLIRNNRTLLICPCTQTVRAMLHYGSAV